mgnify:CR=1 FL=1
MKTMTKSELRDILDSAQFSIRKDKDGDYYTTLSADSDFKHDVIVCFVLNEDGDKLQIMSIADFEISKALEDEAIKFCHQMAEHYSYGQPYFKDGRFNMHAAICNPAEVSKDWLLDSFIKLHVAVFWQFYKAVGEKFDN